jgi:hypothetical protein
MKTVGNMKARKGNSALQRVLGMSEAEVAGIKVANPMSTTGEDTPHRKSIVVEKDRFLQGASAEEAFEQIVEKIARVTDNRREEVENALIVTGSPIAVRKMNRRALNALIQNRLSDPSKKGMAFRQLMTALVGAMYGRSLMNDGFFRTETPPREKMYGIGGGGSTPEDMLGNPFTMTGYTDGVANTSLIQTDFLSELEKSREQDNILPYAKNNQGGVDQTKSEQDWGNILQGSASVISSIGGIIGLFTGGQQVGEGGSEFDYYGSGSGGDGDDDEKKGKGWQYLVIGLVVIGVIVGLYFMFRDKKSK